jgi:hypothetical protein
MSAEPSSVAARIVAVVNDLPLLLVRRCGSLINEPVARMKRLISTSRCRAVALAAAGRLC